MFFCFLQPAFGHGRLGQPQSLEYLILLLVKFLGGGWCGWILDQLHCHFKLSGIGLCWAVTLKKEAINTWVFCGRWEYLEIYDIIDDISLYLVCPLPDQNITISPSLPSDKTIYLFDSEILLDTGI